MIGPTGDTTVIRRNAAGQPYEVTSPTGAITGYEWDGPRMLGSYDSDPESFTQTQAEYGTANEPTLVTRGQLEIHNRYGGRGELLRSWVGRDSTRATVYTYAPDSSYRVASITDSEGHRTELTYESGGFRNLASMSAPDATGTPRVTSYTHDGYGRAATVTDPDGTSSITYDVLNRPTRSVNARGDTTWTALSGADTVTTVTDAAHKTYTFVRNRLGWLLFETDPNNRTRGYAHDLAGNVISQYDRNSRTTSMTYDTLGRVRTRLADGATTTFSYGARRNCWVAAVSAATNDTIRFDRQGQRVIAFVAKELGVRTDRVRLESTLFGDLGVDGIDAFELMQDFAAEFNVDLAVYDHSRYFGPELGCNPVSAVWLLVRQIAGQTPEQAAGLDAITIADLVAAASDGRWKLREG